MQAQAGRILAVDTNPDKFTLAKEMGATDFINPNDYDKPIQDVIVELTDGGGGFQLRVHRQCKCDARGAGVLP